MGSISRVQQFTQGGADGTAAGNNAYHAGDDLGIGAAKWPARWLLHIDQVSAAFQRRHRFLGRPDAYQKSAHTGKSSTGKKRTHPEQGRKSTGPRLAKTKP